MVITRSGASVLGELVNFKIPFISIPLPTSADNHQYKNAEFYQKGYGYLLEEKDIRDKLFELLNSIFNDKSLIKKILFNQAKYSDKDNFKNLHNLLENLNEKINLGQKDIIHFIGIGGIGMSGLAQIMKNMSFRVQGSDQSRNKNTNSCLKLESKYLLAILLAILKMQQLLLNLLLLKIIMLKLNLQKKISFQFIQGQKYWLT